ncbi:MAG: hypothetical protein U0414_01155 [Polyangiaceae bacterium]
MKLAVVALALAAAATPAAAEQPSATAPAPAPDEPVPPSTVRLALSDQAAAFLTEARVRRLMELELPESVHLAEAAVGPLDENAVRLYVDLPEPSVVTIQVQAPQRRLEMRRVDVSGLSWDVAARVTAVAASEAVRSQIAPIRKRPTKPKEPSDAELAALLRETPAIRVLGEVAGAVAPSGGMGLVGSRLGVGFHQRFFFEELSLSALGGAGDRGNLRWLELGAVLGHRLVFTSRVRSELGATFGLARADYLGADAEDGAFTLRAAAHLSLEVRATEQLWLGLEIEPGAVLLDAPESLQGLWLGANLSIGWDFLLPNH